VSTIPRRFAAAEGCGYLVKSSRAAVQIPGAHVRWWAYRFGREVQKWEKLPATLGKVVLINPSTPRAGRSPREWEKKRMAKKAQVACILYCFARGRCTEPITFLVPKRRPCSRYLFPYHFPYCVGLGIGAHYSRNQGGLYRSPRRTQRLAVAWTAAPRSFST